MGFLQSLFTDKFVQNILTIIYQSPFLLSIYKFYKGVVRFTTNTSEIYRVCKSVIKEQENLKKTSEETTPLLTRNEISLSPVLLYRIDRSILYSSKLGTERRIIESKYSELQEAIYCILEKKCFVLGNDIQPESILLRQFVQVISSTYKLAVSLNEKSACSFDPLNQSHEAKLKELWSLLMPEEELTGRISEQWKLIGFQGVDPATDFRGMGLLGLEDLHYFAKNYQDACAQILETSHHLTAWFSFAIVGINITSYILKLVRTRRMQLLFYTHGATKEIYHEFYCHIFILFEQKWKKTLMTRPITPMDFGVVFRELQQKIERDLIELEFGESKVFQFKKRKST